MKKLNFLCVACLVLSLCWCFTACGSDDDSPAQEGNNQENQNQQGNGNQTEGDEISASAKLFVGKWDRESGYNYPYNWYFFADGTCIGSFAGGSHPDGNWNYDSDTKILATTVNGWQYTITLSTQDAWGGISLGSTPHSIAFTKPADQSQFYYQMLYHYLWTSPEGTTLTFQWSSDGYDRFQIKKGENVVKQAYTQIDKFTQANEIFMTTYSESKGRYKKTGQFSVVMGDPYQKVSTLKMEDVTYKAASVR